MESCIVTGGNGYIGSHMCKLLHGKGYSVHIIDNFSTSPNKPVHKYGEFHNLDISDEHKIQELFKKLNPKYIFHFAARALVSESQADPFMYYRENLEKTISLLNSSIKCNINNFIFSSTCATFGIPTTETIDETHAQNPINSYGLTKLLMEKIMRDLASKKLINVAVFRYFNAAGCSPDGEIGENHDPETHLIPNLCRSFLKNNSETFKIFGDNFPTPDGTCIRDYVHVNDLAQIHLKGAMHLEREGGFWDFNLGSEKGYSVKEVTDIFEKIVQTKLNKETVAARAGDPPRLVGNSFKAKKILDYKVNFTLEDCIKHTINYFQNKN